MKAMIYERYGDPDVLKLGERPAPKVAPGEVLIRVRRAAVNPVDWKLMSGALDGAMQTFFPVTPGWDVAGVVEAVGFDVPEFSPGDEVMAYARKDFVHDGTYAELATVPARSVTRKPASLDWDQAAAIPLAGLTAYQLLTRLHTGEKDLVLVHAAAGGVGIQAVQIARYLGARVIGTASEKNHAFLRSLGVEPVAYGEGLVERVRALAPEGVDVVVDFVGGVLEQTRAVLREGGRHGSIVDDSVSSAGGLWAWVRPSGADLRVLADMAAEGRLIVPIAKTFPLEQAADAMRLSQTGHVRGKIVIHVSD
ncbi:NADP-dependent oxidoreductase [Stutzerimonas nosocomialis]|uniref:NADP-dependent oxidoreductase n=1 Tax=Stutzerimonas nosocomialis TaxID=1056496 RepID=UPI0011084417|nr:NADP-dependent oxidoreductase [Stutzerimonas nosocomialis]TLX56658.1 NADP-dependent oxidoreductase [Stutzerimonas nosocomialis]